ncbi:MAG: SPASM domain-containing protein, partial [Thermoguttaceae bacterium]
MAIAREVPVMTTGDCGGGCDRAEPAGREERRRRLNLSAIPKTGTPIISIDLDLTLDCNMRCVYCFKEKGSRQMHERIAFDAVVWLLYASGLVKSLYVSLMGGEPLLRMELIKILVPFGTRRARYYGKRIHFSATTNNTLVTDSVIDFWRSWDVGFHSSIDGIPEVQDRNRPLADARPSSALAEAGIRKVLACRPWTTARCTIVPGSVGHVVENYRYFRSLGFTSIAMVPGCAAEWTEASNGVFREQFRALADLVIDDMRQGTFVRVGGIDDYIEVIACGAGRPTHVCGAGRGMALIDVDGGIWPCHRWNKARYAAWRLGSIYEEFSEERRAVLDVAIQVERLEVDCKHCEARDVCVGDCPAESLEGNPSPYKPHANS